MTVAAEHRSLTEPADRAAAEATPTLERLRDAPVRDAWRDLLALESVATVMQASFDADRGDGAVVETVAVIEGLGRAGVPSGLVYALTSQIFGIQWPLSGVDGALDRGQRAAIVSGETMLCHALTEEAGGSDPLSMTTAAEPDAAGGYRLNGRKAYVTAAPVADLSLTFARTAPGRSPFALTGFLVPTSLPGVQRSAPFAKTAVPEIPMGAIDFADVSIPASAAVTAEGSGLALLTTTTTWERALLMSYAVGVMQHRLDLAVEWATSRSHFGRPMGASPLSASRIAELAVLVHRVRSLVGSMAATVDSHARLSSLATEAAMVKIACAQDLMQFSTIAGKVFGARSVIADSGYDVGLASALAASIYAGSNDLLEIGIARDLGLPVEN